MVSIIVPVYNTGNVLKKCIDSMVHQTYQNLEIILIDDGSEDETAMLCDSLERKYDKVFVYHCKNNGVSMARNYGIEKANGKYILFVDADDYAESQMVEVMVRTAEQYQAELIIAGYYFDMPYINKGKKVFKSIEQKVSYLRIETREELKQKMVYLWDSSLMYNVWNKLFDLDIIRKHHIYFPVGKTFNEDRDFVREYLYHIQNIFVMEDCFYHYIRENDMGATGIYRPDMLEIRKEEFHCLQNFFDSMEIRNSKSREYISREHFDRIVGTIENIFHSNMSRNEIKCEIRRVIKDDDTKYAMMYAQPRSRKMKVMCGVCKTQNVSIIFVFMKLVYLIKKRYPTLFYKLRQSR